MIKPKVKTRYNTRLLTDLKTRAKAMAGSYVTVGVDESAGRYEDSNATVAEVAIFNEFGTDTIPERSFMRSALNENHATLARWYAEVMRKILTEGWTVEKALTALGYRTQVLIQNKIKSNVPPPNAPSTEAKKRRKGIPPRTLIETTLLLRSIAFRLFLK